MEATTSNNEPMVYVFVTAIDDKGFVDDQPVTYYCAGMARVPYSQIAEANISDVPSDDEYIMAKSPKAAREKAIEAHYVRGHIYYYNHDGEQIVIRNTPKRIRASQAYQAAKKAAEPTSTESREIVADKAGRKTAKRYVDAWVQSRGLDPKTLTIEYVFHDVAETIAFGLSRFIFGKSGVELSANAKGIPAEKCRLFGALISSKDHRTHYGVVYFPVCASENMCKAAVEWLAEIDVDRWDAAGYPTLIHTDKGLMSQAEYEAEQAA
jgi:hypothetical protein